MKQLIYTDEQITRMSHDEVERLGLLHPKRVYCQLETSGSPSAWTDYGEYFVGTTGADIVYCANEIRREAEECYEYNRIHDTGLNNYHSYKGHIRVQF